MKRTMVCLGILLFVVACSYAQNSAQASDQDSAKAQKSSFSDTSSKSAGGFDQPSEHHTHVRLGGITVGGGYAHYSGFYPYPFAYGPFYSPFYYPFSAAMLWDPFWGYYPFYPPGYFNSGSGKGELKLTGAPKDASVYVDGGYAGTVDKLKSFWLEPGAYDLAVATPDGRRFEQRVYMLTGKTLKIDAKPLQKPKEGENL